MPRIPELRDELVAMVERELRAADALYEVVEADADFGRELDRRLAGPVTPLILALADWEAAPPEATALLEVNAANVQRFTQIVAEHGWPGLRLVGAGAADAAWMLAQHADRSNEARRAWLPALTEAVVAGDADPRHLATLADRVAAVAGEPQAYGTIAMLAADGEVEYPLPPADPGSLEARREAIGLPSTAATRPTSSTGTSFHMARTAARCRSCNGRCSLKAMSRSRLRWRQACARSIESGPRGPGTDAWAACGRWRGGEAC